jgi:hypothetical protein
MASSPSPGPLANRTRVSKGGVGGPAPETLLGCALGEARARTHRVQATLIFVVPVDVQRVLACVAEDECGMEFARWKVDVHAGTVSHVGVPGHPLNGHIDSVESCGPTPPARRAARTLVAFHLFARMPPFPRVSRLVYGGGERPRITRILTLVTVALLLVVATLLIALPAGAQGDVHVFTSASSFTGGIKFLDFRREGLRLGDRLAARGPLLDGSQAGEVGTRSLWTAWSTSPSKRGRTVPAARIDAATCFGSPRVTSSSKAALIHTARVFPRWPCWEVPRHSQERPAMRR